MTVHELSREQLNELKQTYICKVTDGRCTYGDLADLECVPDFIIFNEYEGIDFVEDDFGCTAGLYKCNWCGAYFDKSDGHYEKDMGFLCDQCIAAITSRGEKLWLEN